MENQNRPRNINYDPSRDFSESTQKLLKFVKHVKELVSKRDYKKDYLDNTSDFYLLYDECNATDLGLKTISLRKKALGEHLKKTDKTKVTPFQILKDSHIADGYNMKKLILNGVGNGSLNYSSMKQIHKIDEKDRLYKLRARNKKADVSVATTDDFINFLNTLIIYLTRLNQKR